jgi:hypothetical protein
VRSSAYHRGIGKRAHTKDSHNRVTKRTTMPTAVQSTSTETPHGFAHPRI